MKWVFLKKFILFVFVSLVLFVCRTETSLAGSILFSPASGSFSPGQIIRTGVVISSSDQAVNAVSGSVSFPSNLVEVVSVSTDRSIIDFWVTQPKSTATTVNFEGVILDPGFTGPVGTVVEILFRVKQGGNIDLKISSASLLANDGLGTNVLDNLGTARFQSKIAVPQQPETPEEEETVSSVTVERILDDDLTNPVARFKIETNLEDVEYFEISIDNENVERWVDDGENIYEAPILAPGDHLILVNAVREKGEVYSGTARFNIKPIQNVVFNSYPKTVYINTLFWANECSLRIINLNDECERSFVVGGTAKPDSMVFVFLDSKDESRSFEMRSDSEGNFLVPVSNISKIGIYNLTGYAIDSRGARSLTSDTVFISVEKRPFIEFGSVALVYLIVFVPLIFLVLVAVFLLWYFYHRFRILKLRLGKEVKESEATLHAAFMRLRFDVEKTNNLFANLQKKVTLDRYGKKVLQDLSNHLKKAEDFIRKEIKDIEDEI
jgi:hypothetical protein